MHATAEGTYNLAGGLLTGCDNTGALVGGFETSASPARDSSIKAVESIFPASFISAGSPVGLARDAQPSS